MSVRISALPFAFFAIWAASCTTADVDTPEPERVQESSLEGYWVM